MATFGPDGPTQCSGLDIVQYSAEGLQAYLGNGFKLVETCRETHITPWQSEQRFMWAWFVRR
jgi:hypothetical protein